MGGGSLAVVRGVVVVMDRQALYLNSDGSLRVGLLPGPSCSGNMPPRRVQYRWSPPQQFENVEFSQKIRADEVHYQLIAETRKFVVYSEQP